MVEEENIKGKSKEDNSPYTISRRKFLLLIPPAVAGFLANMYIPKSILSLQALQPIDTTINPLETYPNRGWEEVYRDIYTPDYTFHYLCAPNCTHGCLLKASVKNGVIRYVDPSFGYNSATDLYGNKSTARWDPRTCVSGISYVRRFYSDRRVKKPMVRVGFKAWVDAGFPRDPNTGAPPMEYFERRGKDDWVEVSWDEAFELAAKTMLNIVKTYSGVEGAEKLKKQGYDPAMIDTMGGAGTQVVKVRGGMPLLGVMRLTGVYRFANMLALLDYFVRGVKPEEAKGGRGWDNYAWHTDLPPGHPMVTGIKTCDFDLFTAENAQLILLWGMNWIATKMADAHWLTESRLHGAKVVTIATEYQSTSNKADYVIIIRPGTDTALALGLAQIIIKEHLFDEEYVKAYTDLPLLVRMDNLKLLKASDINSDHRIEDLKNYANVFKAGETTPATAVQNAQLIPEEIRKEWGDYLVWNRIKNSPSVLTRDHVGSHFAELKIDPALEGEFEVELVDGKRVKVRPIFDLIKEYLYENFNPDDTSEITWAPKDAIVELAHLIASNKGSTLFVTGMGPNHYYHSDLKDRAIFLLAALTANIGKFGGEVGSYAGNYRLELFNGVTQYFYEDPFNIEEDPSKQSKTKAYFKFESAHYYNYGDRPLRVGNKLFTGKTHLPTPTKAVWHANSNSILGNSKWAYDVIFNTLPKIEMIIVNEWFWTATCEYADIVFAVDSWPERKLPDVYGSCSNPFLQAAPRTPLPRMFDTKDDIECYAGVAAKLADLTGINGFRAYWKFVNEDKVEYYINRVFSAGNATLGYSFDKLEDSCSKGVPYLFATRTTPRIVGWEQVHESKPWYTKTGRLEFYRDEDEFIEYGENLPVWREQVDSTYYEPNVILSKPISSLKPKQPHEYGINLNDLFSETRQVRNVIKPWVELKSTRHPLADLGYTHILYTPKYRHACHTMGASTDTEIVFFGPFGDFHRHDKRKPWVGEGYVDINPLDAKEMGIEDGDYIWVDADPNDRPFRQWMKRLEDYKVARWLVRARYYPNIPRKTARAWFHFNMATHGSVEGHETRSDGLAKNPRTNYQAGYRYGSHQSITRSWLKPTLMTDSLVRKEAYGQRIGKGYAVDIHTVVGAPKESFVKLSKAEDGGLDGKGLWRPAELGFRPAYENEAVKKYLRGDFIEVK